MEIRDVLKKEVTGNFVDRIEKLNENSIPLWGKMSISQILAHCNVTYEMVFEDKHLKPRGLKKIFNENFCQKCSIRHSSKLKH